MDQEMREALDGIAQPIRDLKTLDDIKAEEIQLMAELDEILAENRKLNARLLAVVNRMDEIDVILEVMGIEK